MIKILCTRNISETLIHQSTLKGIDLTVKEFIRVQSDIQQKDMPIINSLLHKEEAVVIFTSKNAVRSVGEYIDKNIPDSVSPNWKIYCISEVTLRTIEKHFPKTTIHGKAAYAADLVNIILKQETTKDVYFFCGNMRRDTLPDALRSKGIKVNEMIVYTTKLTPHPIQEGYNGILFFSPSAVESFFSLNKIKPSTVCFAIGNTTAASLREHTVNKVVTGQKQDAQSMIQTATDYFINK